MRLNQEAAAAFVEAHKATVYTFCFRMLGEAECAETLAQEVLLQACLEHPDCGAKDVLRLAYLVCQDALRQRPYPLFQSSYDMQALLGQLPEVERAAMVLRHCLHLSALESAHILGHSHAAVRQMVRQARYRMAAYVTHQDGPDLGPSHALGGA